MSSEQPIQLSQLTLDLSDVTAKWYDLGVQLDIGCGQTWGQIHL